MVIRLFKTTMLATAISLISFFSTAQTPIKLPYLQDNWSKDYEPFRIVGNVYYVGTYDLASYLITTSKGHILINTGLAESTPLIRSHIEKLGFKFSDIKILLTNQVHYDHVGGMAEIKKLTGARMMVDKSDAQVLADGGLSDYEFGAKGSTFEPVKVDRLLSNQDTISLGDMLITILHHPGHTKGSCSFLFHVKDELRTYKVLIANMPTIITEHVPSTYPDIAKDYAYTLDVMKKLQFDIWLAAHASQFGLHKKYNHTKGYKPEAFVDQKGYDIAISDLYKDYLKGFKD